MFGLFGKSKNEEKLRQMVAAGALLVDVRTPEEFKSGSVNGALNIPLNDIQSKASQLKNEKGIILFCRSGSRSGMAKMILEARGVKNVCNGGPWQNVQKVIQQIQSV
jgi:rhodanese-related sulfurtransferase